MLQENSVRRPVRDREVLARMRMAFELYEMAEQMKRQNLRRRHPGASEEEIDRAIQEWLRRRPGAELGDGPGRPSRRFEE